MTAWYNIVQLDTHIIKKVLCNSGKIYAAAQKVYNQRPTHLMTSEIYDGFQIFKKTCGVHVSRKTVVTVRLLSQENTDFNSVFLPNML